MYGGDLIIVANKKHEVYAQLLSGLIIDQGRYEVAVWDDKVYEDNKASIKASNPIIFIGKNSNFKKIEPNIIWRFEKYGMAYGWRGMTAIIQVKDTKIDEGFKQYIRENKQYIDELNGTFTKRVNAEMNKLPQSDIKKGKKIAKNTIMGIGIGLSFPITLPILCTLSGMKSKDIYALKQRAAIGEFLKHDLEVFLKTDNVD